MCLNCIFCRELMQKQSQKGADTKLHISIYLSIKRNIILTSFFPASFFFGLSFSLKWLIYRSVQIVNFSNIAIAILDFSLLLPIQLSLFQLCDSKVYRKVVPLNLFASILIQVLQIGSWLLFCIASHTVIALPTIATAIVVAFLRS